jgi:hypothetical protein
MRVMAVVKRAPLWPAARALTPTASEGVPGPVCKVRGEGL